MRTPNRTWWIIGGFVLASSCTLAAAHQLRAADQDAATPAAPAEQSAPGHLSQEELGTLIRAMGIQVKLDEIGTDYPEHSDFVTQMRSLIDRFDLDQFMATLKTLHSYDH